MARARQHPGSILFPHPVLISKPSPAQFRRDILLLEKQIKDYQMPLAHSKQTIMVDTKKSFVSEKDPIDGSPWPHLSERAQRVPRYGILRRRKNNAKMYRAATNPQNYGVTKAGVYINQARLPPYWIYHQQPDEVVGDKASNTKRGLKIMGIKTRNDLVSMAKSRASVMRTSVKHEAEGILKEAELTGRQEGGGGSRIPQRRFFGPSKGAQDEIVETFDDWAKDAIVIYRRGKGVIKARRPGL